MMTAMTTTTPNPVNKESIMCDHCLYHQENKLNLKNHNESTNVTLVTPSTVIKVTEAYAHLFGKVAILLGSTLLPGERQYGVR